MSRGLEAGIHRTRVFTDTKAGDERQTRATYFTDFIHQHSGSTKQDFASNSASGGNTQTDVDEQDANHPGIARITSGGGTGVTSYSMSHQAGGAGAAVRGMVILEATNAVTWETLVKLPTLSTAVEEYVFRCGVIGNGANTVSDVATDAVMFEYDRTASVNWRAITRAASTDTATSSTTAVGTDWTRLTITATTTSVTFAVDGTTIATHTTNIKRLALLPEKLIWTICITRNHLADEVS
jgi:hypothetical protein